MVHAACWSADQLDLEILSIGRDGLAPKDSCTLEASGRYLFYSILLDGGWVFLSAQLMDRSEAPEQLLSVGDGEDGWRQVCSLIRALERHEIRSLQRPIEAGSGPSGWTIG